MVLPAKVGVPNQWNSDTDGWCNHKMAAPEAESTTKCQAVRSCNCLVVIVLHFRQKLSFTGYLFKWTYCINDFLADIQVIFSHAM